MAEQYSKIRTDAPLTQRQCVNTPNAFGLVSVPSVVKSEIIAYLAL